MSMKNSSDTIGNRTRDLPTFNALPQPTAPPAACPDINDVNVNLSPCSPRNHKGEEVAVWLHTFLTLAHDGGKLSAAVSCCFILRENHPKA